jgi:nitrogen fixation protein NifU and related proteins
MGELDHLYQRVILDHSRTPRNFGPLPGANRRAVGDNPVCGDRLTVSLVVEPSTEAPARITDAAFEGSGCAIAVASASMMTACVRGRTPAEARQLAERLERIVSGQPEPPGDPIDPIDLAALSGVARFPVRVKCARLAWRALLAALADPGAVVSTEE